jgi:hypothetical protein
VDRECIHQLSRVPSTQRYDTYLGLPALVGKSRMKEFKSIKDRVWKWLNDWKTVSFSSREINSSKSCGSSNPDLQYECFPTTYRVVL